MIERIRFKNFKALKDAEIKLGPFNLIVGPNGSGKTSVLDVFRILKNPSWHQHRSLISVGTVGETWAIDFQSGAGNKEWVRMSGGGSNSGLIALSNGQETSHVNRWHSDSMNELHSARVYALEPSKMVQATRARDIKELEGDGANLGGALNHLRDKDEDQYIAMREELRRWLPEFAGIDFERESDDARILCLRQARTHKKIPVAELSEGTLLTLALLTISFQTDSPALVGLEEPDRALHPRLLREVKDALYRMAFPANFGSKRKPVQLIVTTHSPYFLDLFKEHPEQVIVAEKQEDGTAKFRNLSDEPNLREIIGDAPLGEVWYSGILGGVPAGK